MSKTYLVAVDGSDHGWKAVDVAASLAKDTGAGLVLVHVIPSQPLPRGFQEWGALEGIPDQKLKAMHVRSLSQGDAVIASASDKAKAAGIADAATKVVQGSAAEEIVKLANDIGADLTFIGSRGLGNVAEMLVGSVSHKVLHLATRPCVLVK